MFNLDGGPGNLELGPDEHRNAITDAVLGQKLILKFTVFYKK